MKEAAMTNGKRVLVLLLFASTLTIPTSAKASDYETNNGGWFFFFNEIVSFIFGEKTEAASTQENYSYTYSGSSNHYENSKGEYFYIDGKR